MLAATINVDAVRGNREVPVGSMNVGIGPELTDGNSDTPSVGIGRCSPL